MRAADAILATVRSKRKKGLTGGLLLDQRGATGAVGWAASGAGNEDETAAFTADLAFDRARQAATTGASRLRLISVKSLRRGRSKGPLVRRSSELAATLPGLAGASYVVCLAVRLRPRSGAAMAAKDALYPPRGVGFRAGSIEEHSPPGDQLSVAPGPHELPRVDRVQPRIGM